LRHPVADRDLEGIGLHATLRPYQETGVRWLSVLTRLGLGACLADDMGLGKTIQVLALLLALRNDVNDRRTTLVVAPASLLANWMSEIERFAPDLNAVIAHASSMPAAELRLLDAQILRNVDVVITSYGSLLRVPELLKIPWRLVVADEAQ